MKPEWRPALALVSRGDLLVLGAVFWVWMVVDCYRRLLPLNVKIFWLAMIILVPGLGCICYCVTRLCQSGPRGHA